MQIRITVPVLEYGAVQWTRGQIAVVPDELGQQLIDRKEAIAVPIAEQAVLPTSIRSEAATVPRTAGRPKPLARPKGH